MRRYFLFGLVLESAHTNSRKFPLAQAHDFSIIIWMFFSVSPAACVFLLMSVVRARARARARAREREREREREALCANVYLLNDGVGR